LNVIIRLIFNKIWKEKEKSKSATGSTNESLLNFKIELIDPIVCFISGIENSAKIEKKLLRKLALQNWLKISRKGKK
jgi:hypothetical protein